MTRNPQQELIWQGRLHLGDEPGVYGDAAYVGLGAELPVTVTRFDDGGRQFKLVLATADLTTLEGYPGHEITVTSYVRDEARPDRWKEVVIATAKFLGTDEDVKEVDVRVGDAPGPFRLSVRLRIDTTCQPGLYDDFVWRRLSLKAVNFQFFATFGFST